jgi:uncharacterized protein
MDIIDRIATELAVNSHQVKAAVQLLDDGATVPFIARYRKEVTQGLDDTQLRHLEERLSYLRELADRKTAILKSIKEQNKLTPQLKQAIENADSKTLLEDLYLPYKPKRRTKAQIAREAGLGTLIEKLLNNRQLEPEQEAQAFINDGFADITSVLEGARQIIFEQVSENADLLAQLREYVWNNGILSSKVIDGKEKEGQKFRDYFDYQEAIHKIPSHRALAILRGRNENILNIKLTPAFDETKGHEYAVALVSKYLAINNTALPVDRWLVPVAKSAWKIKLLTRIDLDLKMRLREQAEQEAIRVFASNLKDLLLAAPAGPRATMGLDPGIRTGVKIAIVDPTGKLLATDTIYPHQPRKQWQQSKSTLVDLIQQYHVDLVSIGNGTGSRETDQLVAELIKENPNLTLTKIMVSEAGASVYSASELAAVEFPDLDVSLRGAISIARRLQDPLAELVKIDPKSIGVGQYQHDVNQHKLSKSLDAVVEDCVNAVGVDVNTASVALLKRVAGLSASISENIVAYRNQNGPFKRREELKKVPRLGDKSFQQAAGFLRIMDGENPLDASAVHPEAYPLVNTIIADTGKSINELIGQREFLTKLNAANFVTDDFGLPTVQDILQELEKPGRDPRPEFKTAKFKDDVESIGDLKPGMILDGVVTNVANFGAFVDIGVHQDGLVHISHLADKFVKDPKDVVKTGQVVKVKVVEIDPERNRISLSMRLSAEVTDRQMERKPNNAKNKKKHSNTATANSSMSNAFAKAFKQK